MMAFDTADLDAHNGIFALPREEWEETPEFDKLVKDRMAHQEEREQAFLSHKGACFAIYQVKHTDELRDILEKGGKLYTQLKIDDISNLGAVKIRIRSLMAAMEARQAQDARG